MTVLHARTTGTTKALQREIAGQMKDLPLEGLLMLREFTAFLRQRSLAEHPAAPRQMSPAEIVAAARKEAALLADVPRAEIAARFEALPKRFANKQSLKTWLSKEIGAVIERLRVVFDTKVSRSPRRYPSCGK